MNTIVGIVLVIIFTVNMVPAVVSHDTVKIQQAADRTVEQVTEFTIGVITDETKSLPFKILRDEILK